MPSPCAAFALIVSIAAIGCSLSDPAVSIGPTSRPVAVEQTSGQVATKVDAETDVRADAKIDTQAQVTGYSSEFGIGVAVVMGLAIVALGWTARAAIRARPGASQSRRCDRQP